MSVAHLKSFVVAVGSAVLVAGCTHPPVYNVQDAPITTNRPVTIEEIGNAIVTAGVALNIRTQKVKPGLINAYFGGSPWFATVEIRYDEKSYNITYKDSQGLKYDGSTIHKRYNSMVQNLENRIRVELNLL